MATELEIWTCEHGVKEYFLDWQTMKEDEWRDQHDSDEPCEPDIKRINVEDIEQEFVWDVHRRTTLTSETSLYLYRCSNHGVNLVIAPVWHQSGDEIRMLVNAHEDIMDEDEFWDFKDKWAKEDNLECGTVEYAKIDLAEVDEWDKDKLEFKEV